MYYKLYTLGQCVRHELLHQCGVTWTSFYSVEMSHLPLGLNITIHSKLFLSLLLKHLYNILLSSTKLLIESSLKQFNKELCGFPSMCNAVS